MARIAEASEKHSKDALASAVWRLQAEREGPVRVLQRSGIGYTTVKWAPRHAVLHRGQLYILEDSRASAPLQSQSLYIDRHGSRGL